jgi:hypothetical protein
LQLKISVFAEEKEWLEQIAAFEGETIQIILRRCIRTTARHLGIIPSSLSDSDFTHRRGPTEKTKIRAAAFKRIRDAHLNWNADRVATEASRELREFVTAETVRNAYRAMGWKWPRADRVR